MTKRPELLLLKGGAIARENRPGLESADVLLEGDRIKAVASGLEEPDAVVLDCSGKVILPGLFDVHVHLREPGQEEKETIESGSEAAINGGVTGMVAMPNTAPAIDTGGMVQVVMDIARERSRIPIWTTGAITKGRAGRELAGIAGMAKQGAVMLTDDGDPVANPQVLRRAMEYAMDYGLPLASHCETPELSGDGCMNEGPVSYHLGLRGIPACSEEICLDRDIRLARLTGAHVHIQHVTSARGMETIRRAKEDGISVTCEVAPHHLIFNDEDIRDYDTHYKMNPPLRTAEDNAKLLEGLKEGVFDVIATDHAPHTPFEKRMDFASAPFGITGLETALPSIYHYYIGKDVLGWDLLVRRYSAEPRRLLGFDPVPVAEGGKVDLVVFDPRAETTFTPEFMRSRSRNTPFLNKTLRGRIDQVFLGNEVLLDREEGKET